MVSTLGARALVDLSLTYDMSDFFESRVARYVNGAGGDVKLKHVTTPFLKEDANDHVAAQPIASAKRVDCPWCSHSFDPTTTAPVAQHRAVTGKSGEVNFNRGELATCAASVLMKLLYGARMARFDLLLANNALAC